MKESVTYQAIFHEGEECGTANGRIEGQRESLLFLGKKRFGTPSLSVEKRIASIADSDRLLALMAQVSAVETWDELLAGKLT